MTDKQFKYLKDLLVQKGHAHPTHGLRSSGKAVCGVPRSAMAWDKLRQALTAKQASQIIDSLK